MIRQIANTIRGLSADGVEKAASGHPGMPLGTADIAAVLYGEEMRIHPSEPKWPNRDRFVLSAGHGSMLLYSCLHLSGYSISLDDLRNFRQLHAKTAGHPEYGLADGIETTTGPLGQGLANSVGMALSERMLADRFNKPDYPIFDHYTYVIAGDGCMMEGISSEAASLAGHLGLGKLIVFYDDNEISIEGSTDLAFTEDVGRRFEAFGWHVLTIDGHDVDQIREALKRARSEEGKPSLIVAKTTIGQGSPSKAGSAEAHGAPLGKEDISELKKGLGLKDEEFYIPEEVQAYFSERLDASASLYREWQLMFAEWSERYPELRSELDLGMTLSVGPDFEDSLTPFDKGTKVASRASGGKVLQQVAAAAPYLVGGSADLSPSTKTYLDGEKDIVPGDYSGRNIRFGVREHAMAAVCNGISLHGGLRPFCSTFLVFADYMRPSVRLSSLMKQPVIYVFTHDSVYVGEDGPTHEPIEQTESLRIIPGMRVFRPADANEVRLAWIEAMRRTDGPSAIILTRQNLPTIGLDDIPLDGFRRGGYVLEKEKGEKADVVFLASGSEVSLCAEAAELLRSDGIDCRVVSVPSRELFEEQDQSYIDQVLSGRLRVAVEIGVGSGWYRLTGSSGLVYSLDRFGESGPGEQVAKYLGFSAEALCEKVRSRL